MEIILDEKQKLAREKICLPLDGLNTLDEVKARVEELAPVVGLFKIGKESFTRFGPEVVKLVQTYGSNVFLDLKYHDIPNTVKGASDAATKLGVYMFNVHAAGGPEMLKAAVQGAKEASIKYNKPIPKIIAVTMLTSIDQDMMNNSLNIKTSMGEQVYSLAKMTYDCGLHGIVCSAKDLQSITKNLPENFMYVTPGIKHPSLGGGSDQKRVMTPGNAIQDGSNILVVGRAITGYPTKEERLQAGLDIINDIVKN